MSLLKIMGLSKTYPRATYPSLTDFNLELKQGELLALVGESGSGKTTALRLIAGFETPTSGSIELDGREVCSETTFVEPEARGVGMVFQDYALFPHLRVGQNVAFGLADREPADRVVSEMLELVGLQGFETRFPHELSGGQQQRVAIARALAPRPTLLLMDEPLSNLDAASKAEVRDELHDIIRQAETTAVWVSHDVKNLMGSVDRIAILRDGRLQQVDKPNLVFDRPATRYVAEFFGKTNILTGQIVEVGLKTPIGCLDLGSIGAVGETVEFTIRPDHLSLVEEVQGTATGIIQRIHFQGDYCEVRVAIAESVLSVYVERGHEAEVGDTVALKPNLTGIHIIGDRTPNTEK